MRWLIFLENNVGIYPKMVSRYQVGDSDYLSYCAGSGRMAVQCCAGAVGCGRHYGLYFESGSQLAFGADTAKAGNSRSFGLYCFSFSFGLDPHYYRAASGGANPLPEF